MKKCLLSLALGCAAAGAAHATNFDFSKLRYQGAPHVATKAQLRRQLGRPARITQPNYECGWLSASEQGHPFYSLHYGLAVFTGNATDKYELDEVKFAAGSKPLHYGPHAWNVTTTVKDLRQIFGADLQVQPQPGGQLLVSVSTKGEDGAVFIFKDGHLADFQHWTPC